MDLFLTSYLAGTKKLLKEFLQPLVSKEVVFIPTAANVEEYKEYVDEAISVFQELGFHIKMMDVAAMETSQIKELLKNCSCLYISGGNTFYLLQELKRKGIDKTIVDRVSDGIVYIGESAGAIIASADIEYNQIMDDKTVAEDLKDYSGMNLFNSYILPHYGEFPFAQSSKETLEAYGSSLDLLPLTNSQALIVTADGYKILEERSVR